MRTRQIEKGDREETVRSHQLPLRLDVSNAQVWQGAHLLKLTPKAFAVLQYLYEHPSQLVTKDELIQAVWADTVVTDGALAACIRELRKALNDDVQAPRYIETMHRRGYRFLAPLTAAQPVVSHPSSVLSHNNDLGPRSPLTTDNRQSTTLLVGRDADLAQLHRWLAKALQGHRQLVFITGEPGIGKTSLLNVFVSGVRQPASDEENHKAKSKKQKSENLSSDSQKSHPGPWVAVGQCIEHYGSGEAYLPVLEALGRLCREPDGTHVIALLHQHAPTWLVQMPALLDAATLDALQRKTQGATRERMLRELVEALEGITIERPLILVLEDLHWSDPSTLDLLSMLARRTEPARLLILGTYRPIDVIVHEHPLKTVKAELQLHGHCQELALELLSEAAIAEYLTVRFHAPLQTLAQVLHRRTEGNPLFLVAMLEDLLTRGVVGQTDTSWELKDTATAIEDTIPDTIRQLVTLQSERLAPETRRTLEAASIAGMEFSAAAVAAALATEAMSIERHCEQLATHRHFLRRVGIEEWPDGTLAARYSFLHALYQQLWHERVSPTQLQRYHLRIGERKESAYGERVGEIAVEIAIHFEQGRDYLKAIQYFQKAGENASQRSAYQEATNLITKGLELLMTFPDSPARLRQELTLRLALGNALVPTMGYIAADVEDTYARARELCQQLGEIPRLFSVLESLVIFHFNRGELQTAHDLAQQMLQLAQQNPEQLALSVAHGAMGWTSYLFGELRTAQSHLEAAIASHDSRKHARSTVFNTADLRVECLTFAAWTLWALGYPGLGLERIEKALTLARSLSHPFSLAFALGCAAFFYMFCRQELRAQEYAEAAIAVSTEQGFPHWIAFGTIVRGWALAEQGLVQEGLTQMSKSRALFFRPVLLAETFRKVGQIEQGLVVLARAQAFIEVNGMRVWGAELYRLKGELTLQKLSVPQPRPPITHTAMEQEAEGYFLKAITIARQQQAKSWELRATISLARLWQQQGKTKQAHKLLSEIYNWFTEGFDTKDLQEARVLLDSLG